MTIGVLHQSLNLMTKIKSFKIQDGGRLSSSKSFFQHTSAINRPISTFFLQYEAE